MTHLSYKARPNDNDFTQDDLEQVRTRQWFAFGPRPVDKAPTLLLPLTRLAKLTYSLRVSEGTVYESLLYSHGPASAELSHRQASCRAKHVSTRMRKIKRRGNNNNNKKKLVLYLR